MLHAASFHSLPGPEDISRDTLPPGITVLVRTNPLSPSVVLGGYLQGGSIFDPAGFQGLASFTASALMRGTEKRNFQRIFDDLESVGASFGFGSSVHNVNFGGRCLSEDLPMIIELLAECLRWPTFPQEHVDRLRAQALTGFAIRAQDTAEMASLTFDEILFKGHPYGQPEDGFKETVGKIQPVDLINFHKTHYGPRGLVIAAAGAVTAQQVIEWVQAFLGDWSASNQPVEPELPVIIPPETSTQKHVDIPGKTQTDLVMGYLGPKRLDPDFFAASLGNNILGQFGMMGRIGDAVREKSGLAYSASTNLNAWIAAGSWEISAGINPVNVNRTIDLIISEINRFTQDGVTDEELSDTKSHYIGRVPISLESNGGIARGLINIERFKLGLDYYQNYAKIIDQITSDQVVECARNYLNPEKFVTVTAGPKNNEGI